MGRDERKREFPRFDGRLKDAVTDDMAAYVGEVMSSVAFRGGRKGVHGVRTAQELSSFGWTEVRHPYRRGADDGLDFRSAFGIERKMTPCASETVSRLAVQLGSFKEARGGRPGAHESHVCRCGKAGDAPVRLGNARADAKAETQIYLAHALPAGPANCGSGVTGLKPERSPTMM